LKSIKGPCRITSWPRPVKTRVPLLLGLVLLATTVIGADQPDTPETWSDQKIQAAFHDVLAHGDLSDIDFVAKALGLELEIADWQKPSNAQTESIETHVIATRAPPYMRPYGVFYYLTTNAKDGTTRIHLSFETISCPDLVPWGKEWGEEVQSSQGLSSDDGPTFWNESIAWQQEPEGIVLARSVGDSSCGFELMQNRRVAISVSHPPARTPGPGTVLLEQVIDVLVAGDLRDYLTTARVFHTGMSSNGKLRGHRLYSGSATPERIIPGTDSRWFMYYVNDTGWVDIGAPVFIHRRGPRFARLWIYVDTAANCISPEMLEARMRQRHIRFSKKSPPDSDAYLQINQGGNDFSMSYPLQGSCIEAFMLEQGTNV
jgi:hypothetical protein